MKPMRIYADTSVFGGALDTEFSVLSKTFFERVRAGEMQLVISAVVVDEMEGAPETFRAFFAGLAHLILRVELDEAAFALREAYLRARIVGPRHQADALHVAVATVTGCRAIVSWNFRHIVSFKRIPLYNGVNQAEGYGPIAIHTPPEVIFDEED